MLPCLFYFLSTTTLILFYDFKQLLYLTLNISNASGTCLLLSDNHFSMCRSGTVNRQRNDDQNILNDVKEAQIQMVGSSDACNRMVICNSLMKTHNDTCSILYINLRIYIWHFSFVYDHVFPNKIQQ